MKNNPYFIGEIEFEINRLKANKNKKNIGIVNKLTVIKNKNVLSEQDLSFLETIGIYFQ